MAASLAKARDAPAMATIAAPFFPVDAHSALIGGLGGVLRRPTLRSHEEEVLTFFLKVGLHVVHVTLVKELVCPQLLVAAQALSVEGLVCTVDQVVRD